MKASLVLVVLSLVVSMGCGGYGSGSMSMTPAPPPVISPPAGTYAGPQTITISDSLRSTIYFTTDGTTPTLASPVYMAPFVLTSSAKVQAIAAANGYSTSSVAVADYTIH